MTNKDIINRYVKLAEKKAKENKAKKKLKEFFRGKLKFQEGEHEDFGYYYIIKGTNYYLVYIERQSEIGPRSKVRPGEFMLFMEPDIESNVGVNSLETLGEAIFELENFEQDDCGG